MLTVEVERATNYPALGEPSDRVLRARRQDAALRQLERAEKRAAKKVQAGQALLNEAAQMRREALIAAKRSGISAAELAVVLDVSVQRVYQLLSDVMPGSEDSDEDDDLVRAGVG